MSADEPAPADAVAEARTLLAELVDIPSPSGSEGAIVDRIEALCLDWGLTCSRVPTETGRDCLVLGPGDPELVIAAHVDTIDPTWPARATIDGDIVRGLGAADDKGGVVACLLAARRPEPRRPVARRARRLLRLPGRRGARRRRIAGAGDRAPPPLRDRTRGDGLRHRPGRDRRRRSADPHAGPLGPRVDARPRRERDRRRDPPDQRVPEARAGESRARPAGNVGHRDRIDRRRHRLQHRSRPLQLQGRDQGRARAGLGGHRGGARAPRGAARGTRRADRGHRAVRDARRIPASSPSSTPRPGR